ncbi:hypothetical protein DPMN_064692 [Dreissena polymorpha]|uniref:Uncharacterized protein n=1 Tax=Dreissena polymorpha TaxID=45954 RepID=A0A9D4HL94_DREPO|nr:hypothetical protein DPMN_064692 [Dreissena polymorpha]
MEKENEGVITPPARPPLMDMFLYTSEQGCYTVYSRLETRELSGAIEVDFRCTWNTYGRQKNCEQRQLSPSHELTKLENWLKCNWSLKCWGREFHSLAAPKRKELMP